MKARGDIFNERRYKQLVSFVGLEFERKITPTDFDMVIDFGGKEIVIGEFKLFGNELPHGQRLCITNILEALFRSGVKPLGLIACHDVPPEERIEAATLIVSEVWFAPDKGWRPEQRARTVRQVIDDWRKYNTFE